MGRGEAITSNTLSTHVLIFNFNIHTKENKITKAAIQNIGKIVMYSIAFALFVCISIIK